MINVGQIETADLDMKIKFAGLESLLFEDLCKENQAINVQQMPQILLGKSHPVSLAPEEESSKAVNDPPVELADDFDRMDVAESPKSPTIKDKVKKFM